jgi:EAL domain-containing protein (putative c-di-GMP-specific phosphodiesterase class I)
MDIVAEGIETETQLGYVTGAHCTAAQGFFLGRPMPEADIRARLESEWREERKSAVPKLVAQGGKVRRLRA